MAPPRRNRQRSPSPTNDSHIQEPSVTPQQVAVASTVSAPSSTSSSDSSTTHHGFQRVIATFTGQNESVHIDAWLNIFDLVMFEKQDTDKKKLVVRYLDGDALTWFANHVIPILPSLDWPAIKALFITRFQNVTVRPLIAASDLYLKPSETVTKYFNEKMRLLQRTTVPDLDQVAMLNKGMPAKYKAHLITSTILKPSDWLLVALELEATFKKQEASANFRQRNDSPRPFTKTPMAATASKIDFKKDFKTPPPCRFCKDKGIDVNHWHATCPNNPNPKPRFPKTNTATANVSENE